MLSLIHIFTRLIREACRLNYNSIRTGYDIVIISRAAHKGKGFADTQSALCLLYTSLLIYAAITAHSYLKPLGKSIDNGRTYTVQTS